MPELPEVETVRRCLEKFMTGQRIASVQVRRPDLRRPFPDRMAERVSGSEVFRIRRIGKYMLADLSSRETLIMHLGMSGAFSLLSAADRSSEFRPGRHDHVVFLMENGARAVYSDPRRFGVMDLARTEQAAAHPLIAPIGPEPLGDGFGAGLLSASLKARRMPVKSALLDQSIVAGLGNIYVCEALWRAKISPRRRSDRIAAGRITRLADSIQTVLRQAIEAGGSTLRDHRLPDGAIGYFQHSFSVYGREGENCPRQGCKGRISRIPQSGRSTFYCRKCQT